MSFGSKLKKAFGKVDPFAGRMLGLDKSDRANLAPQQQYYGGSEDAANDYRDRYTAGEDAGTSAVSAGNTLSQTAATRNQNQQNVIQQNLNSQEAGQDAQAEQDQTGFDASTANYGSDRTGLLNNATALQNQTAQDANQLRSLAMSAPSDYMKTDQAEYQANQDAGARAAQSLAAQGGAGGLRAALATSAASNLQGNQQAQITRANQYNDLLNMRTSALTGASNIQSSGTTNAANIQSGVSASDQNLASTYSGRQQTANQLSTNIATNRGNLSDATAGVTQAAGSQLTNSGLTSQGQYLGAEGTLETSQLAANQNYEQQRQSNAQANYNNTWRPLKKIFG